MFFVNALVVGLLVRDSGLVSSSVFSGRTNATSELLLLLFIYPPVLFFPAFLHLLRARTNTPIPERMLGVYLRLAP